MPESLTIAAFVFGAVLILLSLVGGEFKLYGAEVSGKASKFGRVVAFALGVGLIIMGLARDRPPNPAVGGNEQPANANANPGSTSNPVATRDRLPESPPPIQMSLTGVWTDDYGDVIRITQIGDSFEFVAENYSTHVAGRGRGTVHGQSFTNSYQTNRPSTGSGSGMISADGMQTTGTYFDSMVGRYTLVLYRKP
jgi:hypothetical protein